MRCRCEWLKGVTSLDVEARLAKYILDTTYEDLPPDIVDLGKNLTLTIFGTTIAGGMTEGLKVLLDQIKEWGGKKEATILIHGGQVPAYHAVLINSFMARALDLCDGIRPGMHVGSSVVPTALAAAELAGGCSGKEFVTALVVGAEVADRINLVSNYDGFDPTGICAIFAAAGAAARILRLREDQILHALAIAFNKSAGSFQSNIEGALSVRLIQGFTSQGGILSALLAKKGFNGPKNFLDGTYGYFHLYAKGKYDPQAVVGDLGERFEMRKTVFKRYPSCGDTLSSTDGILELVMEKGITPEDVRQIDIQVTPYAYRLTGNEFRIRDNPRVDAQFNIRYCVANALLRKSSRLEHFEESFVRDPKIMEIVKKINVSADPELDKRGETAMEMQVLTKSGTIHYKSIEVPTGSSEKPLTQQENMERFKNCTSYATKSISQKNIEKLVSSVRELEKIKDIRALIPLLIVEDS